jgi:hypothetical protein
MFLLISFYMEKNKRLSPYPIFPKGFIVELIYIFHSHILCRFFSFQETQFFTHIYTFIGGRTKYTTTKTCGLL